MFARFRQKAKGLRTFIGAGALGVVGALGVLGQFDLTPLVQLFVHNDAALPLAMLAIGVTFGVIRYYTDTTAGGYQSATQAAPAYKGVDDGE